MAKQNKSAPKSIICVIVRMKSQRLPKKALAMIKGQTVIEHVIDRMKLARIPAEVILCTSTNPDDAVLVDYAKIKNIKWFRGSEDDVLKRLIDVADREKADIVVRVTGDNPLTDPEHIDKSIKHHIKTNAEYTYTQGLIQGTRAEIMSVDALKKCHKMAEDPSFTEYLTWYIRRPEYFHVESIQAVPELTRDFRLTLDEPKDLELLRAIYKELYKPGGKKLFTLKQVVDFLDANPDLAKINKNIKPKDVRSRVNVNLKPLKEEGKKKTKKK